LLQGHVAVKISNHEKPIKGVTVYTLYHVLAPDIGKHGLENGLSRPAKK